VRLDEEAQVALAAWPVTRARAALPAEVAWVALPAWPADRRARAEAQLVRAARLALAAQLQAARAEVRATPALPTRLTAPPTEPRRAARLRFLSRSGLLVLY